MTTLRPLIVFALVIAWLILAVTSPYPDHRFPEPVDSSSYFTRP